MKGKPKPRPSLWDPNLIIDGIHRHALAYLELPEHPPGTMWFFCSMRQISRRDLIRALAELRDLTREDWHLGGERPPASGQIQLALQPRKPLCTHKGPDLPERSPGKRARS